jgi:hypothetical protein
MWVLQQQCPECGFDTQSFPPDDIGRLSRGAAEPWPAFLTHPLVRKRPDDECWSALEYGCHVRDVFRLGVYRLQRMLQEDNPQFDNWDQDETAVAERYDLQDPVEVADQILAAATAFGDLYDTVATDQWHRPSMRSDGSPFTVDSFGRYLVHDPVHHVFDVRRGYELLQGVS